ncbi:hypothetical protein QL231_16770 [Bacillus bombysepticus]|uniref:hypothetical protein n=1 Tax=Bacillus TaxID=1386 RepID=UPI000505ABE1|nr:MULTISPECIES: hypothetical protein [Bacillus]MDJ0281953.1 hypothetical protein [Bacillus bombysepticus]KFL63350.1 prohead protease domain protein [Bacillus cereus ATCC 10876]MDJ0295772.1 hypothetical protein [Bacillus bombysepticus]MDJ0301706.1 hypothetical protein [Bacillus bombysepticus]MEB9920608.1 hypothetical protein [Bacillus cereus]
MVKTKIRTFDITKLSTRDATEEQPSKITGYAAVFNSKTTIGGWFDEVIYL